MPASRPPRGRRAEQSIPTKLVVVRREGFEPPKPHGRLIYSQVRLPLRHLRIFLINLYTPCSLFSIAPTPPNRISYKRNYLFLASYTQKDITFRFNFLFPFFFFSSGKRGFHFFHTILFKTIEFLRNHIIKFQKPHTQTAKNFFKK